MMQAFRAIGAALLMALAMSATSRAETTTGPSAVSPPPAAGCDCPGLQHRHAWRPHRHAHFYAWHRRRWWPGRLAEEPPPPVRVYYNLPLPRRPYDTAYSRLMTQPSRFYWFAPGGVVFGYDIMADAYVQLAQTDAQRVLAAAGFPR